MVSRLKESRVLDGLGVTVYITNGINTVNWQNKVQLANEEFIQVK